MKNSNTTLSSVSSGISWHTEINWALRRRQILNKRELPKASSSIFNSVLRHIAVHYFNMNRRGPKLKELSEIRFGSMIFLLRMAGIPLKMKNISTIYAIYMVTVIVCCFTTIIGVFADVYIHWDDLGHAMTTMRTLFPFMNVMWIFTCCR
jgi:hypothetical protein